MSGTSAIDVLLTVYNGERFIEQTIESVINQSFSDWRLIIVDDLSTDSTPQIIQSYADADSRITLLKGNHKGVAAAANIGLEAVTAPLVARLDADDVCLPDRLQIQYDYLKANPDISAVGSDVILVDENNHRLRHRRAPTGWENIENILKTRNRMCHPSSMIRTDTLRKIGGYRNKFKNSLDYDLWLRISEVGKIDNISLDLLLYRRHSSQISASNNAHRQTIYSVAAVTDYFLRRYQNNDDLTQIDECDPKDIAEKLASLYQYPLSSDDITALNRHAIRLLRHARVLDPGARNTLKKAIKPHLTFRQLLKLWFYQNISAHIKK
jgi:glycosyltransferase involved in cell wall biosynthesis